MKFAKPAFYPGCLLVALIIVYLTIFPTGPGRDISGGTIRQDSLGRRVILPAIAPRRIISLSPSNTEILFALGLKDRLIAVTDFSDYPEEAKSKPRVGSFQNPDLEKIVSLRPDLVLAAGELHSRQIKILEKAGITVVAIEPRTMQEVLDAIQLVAEATGVPEKGLRLVQKLRLKLAEIHHFIDKAQKRRVFVEVWDEPFLTIGRKSYLSDIINQAGGINVAAGRNLDYMTCDLEMLYAFNPDTYIVVRHSGIGRGIETEKDPRLANVLAIKENRVFRLSDDILSRPGPRSFDGLAEMAKTLHPGFMKGWQEE